jgi:hypothetical protein
MGRQGGQVMAFMALVLSIVLLPVAAYAVDSATLNARAAHLQAATAEAALRAAQEVDVADLRARGALDLDSSRAVVAATAALAVEEPSATVASVSVSARVVTVASGEMIKLPFGFVAAPLVKLEARASARLAAGYDSPSSRLPLPMRTF